MYHGEFHALFLHVTFYVFSSYLTVHVTLSRGFYHELARDWYHCAGFYGCSAAHFLGALIFYILGNLPFLGGQLIFWYFL